MRDWPEKIMLGLSAALQSLGLFTVSCQISRLMRGKQTLERPIYGGRVHVTAVASSQVFVQVGHCRR